MFKNLAATITGSLAHVRSRLVASGLLRCTNTPTGQARYFRYKNWVEISKIEDKRLMLAIACVDINSSDGAFLATLGRPWFTDKREEQIRYPLSVVIETSKDEVRKAGGGGDWELLECYANDVLGIPTACFVDNEGDCDGQYPVLPKGDKYPFQRATYAPGSVVVYDGQQYVVTGDRRYEGNPDLAYIALSPIACIDPAL
jgi:hypothetical protein